jgi:hypothetical protein
MDQKLNVKHAKFFSVSADEAVESSNKEQLPLVIRFVDATNSVHEELVELSFVILVHLEIANSKN